MYKLLFVLFMGCIIAGRAKCEIVITVNPELDAHDGMPKLEVFVANNSDHELLVPVYDGRLFAYVDYWHDYEGLVLVDENEYIITSGAFVIIPEVAVPPQETMSFVLNMNNYVPMGGEEAGTKEWQEGFLNAQRVVVVVRIEIGQEEYCSHYTKVNLQPTIADEMPCAKSSPLGKISALGSFSATNPL